jgi:phosphoribosylamine-glycine ligase
VTAVGEHLDQARVRAYEAVGLIQIPGMHFRRDIALHAASGV